MQVKSTYQLTPLKLMTFVEAKKGIFKKLFELDQFGQAGEGCPLEQEDGRGRPGEAGPVIGQA